MKKSKLSIYSKLLCIAFITAYIVITTGCGKSGAIEDPVSYLTPSIQNLQTKSTNIAKCTGGILSFTCDWTSPQVVSSANAYLSFVKTIDLPITEPIGVIGSAAEMIVSSSTRAVVSDGITAVMTNDPIPFDFGSLRLAKFNYASTTRSVNSAITSTASETVNDPIATADFYRKYAEPILIPVRINTNETAGQFFAQIPFTTGDIASAPLGVHQMMLYMKINGCKTNTLSFELTFVP